MLIRTVGTGIGFVFSYFCCDQDSAGDRIMDSNYVLCWISELLFQLHASDVAACYFVFGLQVQFYEHLKYTFLLSSLYFTQIEL